MKHAHTDELLVFKRLLNDVAVEILFETSFKVIDYLN